MRASVLGSPYLEDENQFVRRVFDVEADSQDDGEASPKEAAPRAEHVVCPPPTLGGKNPSVLVKVEAEASEKQAGASPPKGARVHAAKNGKTSPFSPLPMKISGSPLALRSFLDRAAAAIGYRLTRVGASRAASAPVAATGTDPPSRASTARSNIARVEEEHGRGKAADNKTNKYAELRALKDVFPEVPLVELDQLLASRREAGTTTTQPPREGVCRGCGGGRDRRGSGENVGGSGSTISGFGQGGGGVPDRVGVRVGSGSGLYGGGGSGGVDPVRSSSGGSGEQGGCLAGMGFWEDDDRDFGRDENVGGAGGGGQKRSRTDCCDVGGGGERKRSKSDDSDNDDGGGGGGRKRGRQQDEPSRYYNMLLKKKECTSII